MPIANPIPTLAQIQHFRKTGKFDPAIRGEKIDIQKSACIAGVIVEGELIGFGVAERVSPEEVARHRQQVSKSIELPPCDLNAIFDDSALLPQWSPDVVSSEPREVVQKSAASTAPNSSTDDLMQGLFPQWLQTQ
ncbi:hypothetical protein Psta_0456 [Pirellula staleyi DSM 6068]|uniref:Uncharacterized protein n=1 Tax=Pirellula staleyi (strain ATCC 27377 / DSM 6068 / ICPB 4128) TaxID=530564 RepID=D2R3B3_PIRSD|nr:hypothetical protein [Pirellula staleyi]ADB15144.1 hypothetical protein Psta_0456 [Pirellula staleyi DSM 6068]